MDLKRERRKLAARRRRLIFNNDGNDCWYPKPVEPRTAENFLAQRTASLVGSQVDAMAYCDGVVNRYMHHSAETELLKRGNNNEDNWAHELLQIAGRDNLQIITEFSHAQGWEAFWSMRMNDTHDAGDPALLGLWKKDHPHLLMGKFGDSFPYGGYCRWSALDYGLPEVREKIFRILRDVGTRYDVDGLELDFDRHPHYFRPQMFGKPVTQEHCDQMTGLLRRVREMGDERGKARGRPLLMVAHVQDSLAYAKGLGLDVRRWLEDDLIDILVVGGYLNLAPWEEMVALGRRYEVPVYVCLSASRVETELRDGLEELQQANLKLLRGQALRAWEAGASGIHLFNYNPPQQFLRELGDPDLLRRLERTDADLPGNDYWLNFLKDGAKYRTIENKV
jgi:hypothetical protein